jgi:DNA-binding NtrC family response regulator
MAPAPDRERMRGRHAVLVVADESAVRESVRALLEPEYTVFEAADADAALEVLGARAVDVVVLDQPPSGAPGIDVLSRLKACDPSVVVVMSTAGGDVRTAVEAMGRGVYDYLVKPFDPNELRVVVRHALDQRALEDQVLRLRLALAASEGELAGFEGIVGRHPTMVRVYELITRVAPTPATALIMGESGTGKELVARAIHRRSDRREQPFVAVNVAALPDGLLEAELFGHERGAFTGATGRKPGKFELAHGGTLFLDEIGSLRLDLQAKLLRILQEREVERLGGRRPIPVDVRILAATNVDLHAAVRARVFREDLYYRLNVVPIRLPALRERREDIPLLVEHFLRKAGREYRRPVRGVSASTLDALVRYDWPGNVRELENVMCRAVLLAQGPVLHLHDVPLDVALPQTGPRLAEDTGLPLRQACAEFERQYVLRVLERVGWNVSRAARLLHVHRNTVLAKLDAWGVRRPGLAGRGRLSL